VELAVTQDETVAVLSAVRLKPPSVRVLLRGKGVTMSDDNSAQLEAQMEGFAGLGKLIDWRSVTNYPDRLDERIEARVETEQENLLSVEIERTVRIVLCTGGPHCEIRWPENGNPTVVCYGWFGSDRVERDLTDDEIAAVERVVYGLDDIDELSAMIGDR
jgi:hypothetical protein